MSILNDVKKMLGLEPDNNDFDIDLILNLNSVFSILHQLGCGPEEGFFLFFDGVGEWSVLLQGDDPKKNFIKTYVFLKVKSIFDPSSSATVTESINQTLSEYEWRIHTMFRKEGIFDE